MAKETTIKSKIATTEDVAQRVFLGMKNGKIKFGDMKEVDSKTKLTRTWKAEPFENGAIVSFQFEQIHGLNKRNKKIYPSYKVCVTYNDKTEMFSGIHARKVYMRLMNPPKKREIHLTEDVVNEMEQALSDI